MRLSWKFKRWRRDAGRLFTAAMFAMLCVIALSGAASGQDRQSGRKLVGVIFDNSGSMIGRENLPVFGIQILAASLNISDRLYGLNFADFLNAAKANNIDLLQPSSLDALALLPTSNFVRSFSLGSTSEQAETIGQFRRWSQTVTNNTPTPYAPIETMIAHLASEADKSDEVHLFVFTDGEFNQPSIMNNGSPLPGLERRLTALRERVKAATFNIHFMAFADPRTQELIGRQNVAATLDKVFNRTPSGRASEFVYFTNDFAGLRRQLVRIVSRIANTPPDPDPRFVTRLDRGFAVTPPFTISKLIVVTTAPDSTPLPAVAAKPPNVGQVESFSAKMLAADRNDKLPNAAGQKWHADISHMSPSPALPANRRFDILFDRPINDNTDLLFRTNIAIDWSVYDLRTGEKVPRSGNQINLNADQEYEVRAHVIDNEGGQNPQVLPEDPTGTMFSMSQRDNRGAAVTRRMRVSTDRLYASSAEPLRYDTEREDDIHVSLRLPGFVTSVSQQLKIKVVRTNVRVDIAPPVPVQPCPQCTPGKVEPLLDKKGEKDVSVIKATFTPLGGSSGVDRRSGTVRVSLQQALPSGVSIRVPGASEPLSDVNTAVEVPFSTDAALEMTVSADERTLDLLGKPIRPQLLIEARDPMRGAGASVFEIAPRLPPTEIKYCGLKPDCSEPGQGMKVTPDQLTGKSGFYLRVSGWSQLLPPPTSDDLRVAITSLRAGKPLPDRLDGQFFVPVRSGAWCTCFVSSGNYAADVSLAPSKWYAEQVKLQLPEVVIDKVSIMTRLAYCAAVIAGVIAALYFLAGLWRFSISHRFNVRNRLFIDTKSRAGDSEPPKRISRGMSRIMARVGPFLMPFVAWNERSQMEGLSFEAADDGVTLLPPGDRYKGMKRRGRGAIDKEFVPGDKDGVLISWNETIEDSSHKPPRLYTFRPSID